MSVETHASAMAEAQSLDELYPAFNAACFTAGWHKKRPSLWGFPRTEFRPMLWRYADGKLALDRASEWIGTELAERRNLLMFNPVGDNDYATTPTLVCAYQLIKPGEYARAHRHTPNALRIILDAEPGVVTVVNGIKLPMVTGDIALTPGWTLHSHYNEGTANAYWIDVLDVPLVHRLEPMFYERSSEQYQKIETEPAESEFLFPMAWVREQLEKEKLQPNGTRELVLRHSMPTMKLSYLQFTRHGRTGQRRTTSSHIFSVMGGSGTVHFGAQSISFERGDVFATPGWAPYDIEAAENSLIFEVSDEPVFRMLGFYREQFGAS